MRDSMADDIHVSESESLTQVLFESDDERVHVCTVEGCDKYFKRKDRLIIHLRTHTGERPFKCEEPGCNKSYCRQAHLLRHQENAHNQTPAEDKFFFECEADGCSSVFTQKFNLQKHFKRQHSADVVRPYKCEVEGCDASFRKHHQLSTHSITHTNVNPFKCTHLECRKTFKTSTRLRRHLKVHQGYKCTEEGCGVVFGKWTELRGHKSKAHLQELLCDVCSKIFPKRHLLNIHQRSHHTNVSTLPCPYEGCDREYWHKGNLKTHVLRYHEEQRFPCTVADCGKTFASKQKLKGHHALHNKKQAARTEITCKSKKKRSKRKNTAAKLSGISSVDVVHELDPVFVEIEGHSEDGDFVAVGTLVEGKCAMAGDHEVHHKQIIEDRQESQPEAMRSAEGLHTEERDRLVEPGQSCSISHQNCFAEFVLSSSSCLASDREMSRSGDCEPRTMLDSDVMHACKTITVVDGGDMVKKAT
ncbi:transcription factor IIIA-like [Littorina saxatilis]